MGNIIQKRTRVDFEEVKLKIGKKFVGWKASTLSVAAKAVLIKCNLTCIPQSFINFLKNSEICLLRTRWGAIEIFVVVG